MTRDSVKWNGREVHHPAARAGLIGVGGFAALIIGTALLLALVPFMVGLLVALIVLAVAAVIAHPVLRATGRRGFITHHTDGIAVHISRDSFRRVP